MISIRYAKALFNYALEKKAIDEVFGEIQKLITVFENVPDFRVAIDNPVMSIKNKLALVKNAISGDVSDILDRFIKLVLDRRRENHLYRIALSYQDLYRKYKNITVGRLITATSFDNSVIEKIKEIVQKGNSGVIEFKTEINPEIGGGFVLFIDSYRLDASVATQLKTIKKQLLDVNKRIA